VCHRVARAFLQSVACKVDPPGEWRAAEELEEAYQVWRRAIGGGPGWRDLGQALKDVTEWYRDDRRAAGVRSCLRLYWVPCPVQQTAEVVVLPVAERRRA
jgi:hypothetical protein